MAPQTRSASKTLKGTSGLRHFLNELKKPASNPLDGPPPPGKSSRTWEESIAEFKAILEQECLSKGEKPPEWHDIPLLEPERGSETVLTDPKAVPANSWPIALAAKVNAESRRLQQERFKANHYVEVPVTSRALENFPVENVMMKRNTTNPVFEQYRADAVPPRERIKKEDMLKLGKVMRDMGKKSDVDYRQPGIWKQWA
ncbi:hypothetical protein AA313_de0209069 [Arthrobotrys entomopaga]|nr:hypothetical protein AA313_de0209069 [Arthrobotrys entomopaga]